jgi:hypothetical protein
MDAVSLLESETVLLLAERPAEAVGARAGLVAALCRWGRPPFVVVLTDGGAGGAAADRAARGGLTALGLDSGRLLMFGIADRVPHGGPVFDAAVAALCFVTWRHDCNVVCASAATLGVARAAAMASGLGLVGADDRQYHLLQAPRPSAREAG